MDQGDDGGTGLSHGPLDGLHLLRQNGRSRQGADVHAGKGLLVNGPTDLNAHVRNVDGRRDVLQIAGVFEEFGETVRRQAGGVFHKEVGRPGQPGQATVGRTQGRPGSIRFLGKLSVVVDQYSLEPSGGRCGKGQHPLDVFRLKQVDVAW